MPQPERAKNMREILKYLRDVGPVTIGQCMRFTRKYITKMGARDTTIRNYIDTLLHSGLAEIHRGSKIRLSAEGKKWLEQQGYIDW